MPGIECGSWGRQRKEAWGQRQRAGSSVFISPTTTGFCHYVKMQKDDGIIGEEADLPAFLQHSKEDKENSFKSQHAARDRLRRCILGKAEPSDKADPNPTILLHTSEFRLLCPSTFQCCPHQKTVFLHVLAAPCYL